MLESRLQCGDDEFQPAFKLRSVSHTSLSNFQNGENRCTLALRAPVLSRVLPAK